MAEKDLNELFVDTLKDIYYAEKQIYKCFRRWPKQPPPIIAANLGRATGVSAQHREFSGHQARRCTPLSMHRRPNSNSGRCDRTGSCQNHPCPDPK